MVVTAKSFPPLDLSNQTDIPNLDLLNRTHRTSGQHNPIYELIKPYHEFPKKIEGDTLWLANDYGNGGKDWKYIWTKSDVDEIWKAVEDFEKKGLPLTAITKDLFPLPKLSPLLHQIRHEILYGKGFVLFKGLPVDKWTLKQSAIAYMGLGTHFGYFVSQNGKGHTLGHVKDLGHTNPGTIVSHILYF